jgi:rod shape-determining protein MreD
VSGGPVIKPFDPFSQDASALRKTLVGLALPAALFAAVVAQLTVVNRLPLPGGDAPDLVLLLVAAVSVVTGAAMVGTVAGFAGGLALDVAPPASHYAGEYALIFCLAGYLAARVMVAIRFTSNGDAPDPSIALAVLAVATAAGEAGKAGLGMLLSDPNVTGPTIRHVLPGAVLYDLLLTPVVYWLVATVARLASPVAERAPAPVFFGPQRLASVFRAASTGAVPNLRLAGTGAKFTDDRPVRREPRLRLADARSNSFPRTVPAGSNSARVPSAGGRAAKLNFAHSRSALTNRGSAPVGRAAKLHFAGDKSAAIPPPRRRPSGPGKGWLGSGRRKPPTARLATPGKGWLRPARRPRANWYSNGPTTSWIRRSRTKDRWRSRRRSLSGSLLSTVRDLLPTGERR